MRSLSLFVLLVLAAAGSAPAQERSRKNPFTSPADVTAGMRLYRPLCSNCHGHNGEGRPGFTPNFAAGLQTEATDFEVVELLRNGIPGTRMPAFTLTDREAWQVVTVVRSFANTVGAKAGDADSGAALFRERGCARCHQPGGSGPDLRAVATVSSAEALREAILHPNNEVHPRQFRVQATTADGQRVEGRRLNEDSFSAQIRTDAGELLSLDKTKLRDFEVVHDSAMPSYADRLSEQELVDLIAYLAAMAPGVQQ